MISTTSFNVFSNGINPGVRTLILFFLRLYRIMFSPFLPPLCRFEPTCSQYALDCFQSLSPGQAFWLTLKRLGRCHPYCNGGYDPSPTA